MRLLLLPASSSALALAFVLSACATQPSDVPDVSVRLIDLERQSWVAWQHHDAAFFANFLADDHVELGATGPAAKPLVVSFVGSGSCTVDDYTIDRFHVTRLAPDTALVTYHVAQSTTCAGIPIPSPAWASSLYVQREGRWLNAAYQQTAATR